MNEKEYKELVDSGLITKKDDEILFKKLFSGLSKSNHDFLLPSDFSKTVAKKIKTQRRQSRKDLLWLILGVITIAFSGTLVLVITDNIGKVLELGPMKWYTVIFAFMIFVFQKIEKRIFSTSLNR